MKKHRKSETGSAISDSCPIAVIGLGCLFPQANDIESFWTNIKNGTDAITEVPETHWKAADYFNEDPKASDQVYAKRGGFLSPVDFNPMEYGVLPNALEATDTSQLLGMVAVEQALKDAGYDRDRDFDREKVSVILGVTGALELVIPLGARLGHPRWRQALKDAGIEDEVAEEVIERIADSYVPWQENSFPGLLGNVVAGRISRHFNFGGTNCVVDAACGSSLSALNLGALELSAGRADMVVSGGIDTFNDIFMYTCFSKTPALSPSGHARPFDADADGTTLGEGLGVVILKRLADAERDGDKIYAVIRGIGASSDGRGAAIYEPSAAGQEKAVRRAYAQADIAPESIELIEAHGTGTKVGDAIEIKGLRSVFGEADTPHCAIGSIKSQIGHTKAAAGSAGMIKACLALYHKTLPPTIKVERLTPALTDGTSPFYVNTRTRPWVGNSAHPRRAGISALGFGGSNYHCLLEEHRPDKPTRDWQGNIQIALFSAAEEAGLKTALENFPADSDWQQLRRAAAESREQFDADQPYRLGLVIERDKTNCSAQRQNALTLLQKNRDQKRWTSPDGVFYAAVEGGPAAILFPGQGAQYPGMLQDLAVQFPSFLGAFEQADRSYATHVDANAGRLTERVFPPPRFDQEQQTQDEARLRATETAQPALGAVSLGALDVLSEFGFRAEAFAGHSYGELTALCAAGCFDRDTLHLLSRLRGELMANGEGDRGSMLAVSAPLAEIEPMVAEAKLDLVLANRNTPEQGVLSGSSEEIRKAEEFFTAKGVRCKPLSVAAAFHSRLVADAARPFGEKLQEVEFAAPTTAVYANTSGGRYPSAASETRDLLAGQLANPVDFVTEIESMYQAGIRTFVEVGPGARLTGMVKAILTGRDHQALAIDASNGKRSGVHDLARALTELAVSGQSLDLTLWDEGFAAGMAAQPAKKSGLTIAIGGANHFVPPAPKPPAEPRRERASAAPSPVKAPEPQTAAPAPAKPAPEPAAELPGSSLQEALRISQQSLQALQTLQEQTAQLHKKFLEGQESATRSFLGMIEQQQSLLRGGAPVQASTALNRETPPSVAAQPETAMEPSAMPERPAEQAPAVPAGTSGRAGEVLLEVVAEKTGYPVEMLELEMALDADLGIDSIKRVEILSTLQERLPEAPAVRPEDLGSLQTLGQIVAHLDAVIQPAAETTTSAPAAPAVPAATSGRAGEVLLEVVAEKTGYPAEMLELEMALDADLGIDSIKRVEILSTLQERLPEAPAVRPEDLGSLQTLGQIVAHLDAVIQPAAETTTSAPAAPAVPAATSGRAGEVLLEVVAEKTGYPAEMLELEMALDADLGIDSIKRVEILSALQERLPEAPAVRPEELGGLQTLGQIIAHLEAAGGTQPSATAEKLPETVVDRQKVAAALMKVIAAKTGYPVEMLEPEMALDADLGIDSIKRVEILSALQEELPAAPAVKPEHLGTLQTVEQIIDFLASVSGAAKDRPTSRQALESVQAGEGIERKVLKVVPLQAKGDRPRFELAEGSAIWISDDGSPLADAICQRLTALRLEPVKVAFEDMESLDTPAALAGLVLLAPVAGADDRFLGQAFRLLQKASGRLQQAGRQGQALLATVSRLNGGFGLPPGPAPLDVVSGGLAGFAKTAGHEWPDVHCKALDLARELDDPDQAAQLLVDELFIDGPTEVGLTPQGLQTLKLTEASLPADDLPPPLAVGDLVVISGGARGVTAETAVALASSCRATLLLLGRSPLPEAEPEWLAGLSTEADIKRELAAHADQPLKPRALEEQYQQMLRGREIENNLQRMRDAGGQVIYRSVDLRDASAVAGVLEEIRAEHGPVKGLIHGAGVLADRLIEDKTTEQFDQVYGTKVAGLRALLAATAEDDLKFMALFSSSTGRFGRSGQVDYAVANEVLNKLAQEQARLRPDCRVLALNWGPWDGGMVTPALKKLFEQEGVEVINLRAGADYLLKELSTSAEGPVELVILGSSKAAHIDSQPQPHPNIYVSRAFDLELSIEQFPFLESHVIDTKAVLPMAVMVEWLAHGAIHENPGLKFHGFNDLRVLKGVTLEPEQRHSLQVMTGKAFKSDGFHVVPVELSGTDSQGQNFVHARAKIVLAGRLPEGKEPAAALTLPVYPHGAKEIYRSERLFHGPDFQGIREMIGCSPEGIAALANPAPVPGDWFSQPLRNTWLADPLALDCAFQLMILWSFEKYRAGSLPVFAGRYRQYAEKFPEDGAEIRARIVRDTASKATAWIEFLDPGSGRLLARMEDYECVIDASLNESFQRNKLRGAA